MSRTDQKKFVKDLAKAVVDNIIERINNDDVPSDWDGCELRAYLADKFKQSASYSSVSMGRSRKRAYNNAMITSSNL